MKKTTYIEFKTEEIEELVRQHIVKACPPDAQITLRIDYDNEEDGEPYGKFVGMTAIVREKVAATE